MKSKLPKIALALVILLVVVYVGLDFFLGSVVKAGVNRFAPLITKTRVELQGAHLSPVSGSGTLTGLFVGNPKGWSSDKAIYFGRVHVEVSPGSVFGDHIIVNDLSIDDPEFVYETKVVSSNIGDLLKNIQGSADSGKADDAKASNGRVLKFEVKHFHMQGGRLSIGIGPTAIPLPMPPIELSNIGTKEGGITSSQLAVAIMQSMAGNVVGTTTQAAGKIGSTMGAAAGAAAKDAANGIKGLFGGKP